MKILKAVYYFFLWIFYVCITLENRVDYQNQQLRYGKYAPNRDYSTWKEFWKMRGYNKS